MQFAKSVDRSPNTSQQHEDLAAPDLSGASLASNRESLQSELNRSGAASSLGGGTRELSQVSWQEFEKASNAGIFGRNDRHALERAASVLIEAREKISAETDPAARSRLEDALTQNLARLDKGFRENSPHSKGMGLAEYMTRQFHGEDREIVLKAFGPDPKAYAVALRDAINTDQPQKVVSMLRDLRDRPEVLDQVRESFSRHKTGPGSLDSQVVKFFNDRIPEKRLRPEVIAEVSSIMQPGKAPAAAAAKPVEAAPEASPVPKQEQKPEEPAPEVKAERAPSEVVAKKGDSLWSIAKEHLSLDGQKPSNHEINLLVHEIYRLNRDKMPQGMNQLRIGAALTMPEPGK